LQSFIESGQQAARVSENSTVRILAKPNKKGNAKALPWKLKRVL
jgi:hypothetical protein